MQKYLIKKKKRKKEKEAKAPVLSKNFILFILNIKFGWKEFGKSKRRRFSSNKSKYFTTTYPKFASVVKVQQHCRTNTIQKLVSLSLFYFSFPALPPLPSSPPWGERRAERVQNTAFVSQNQILSRS